MEQWLSMEQWASLKHWFTPEHWAGMEQGNLLCGTLLSQLAVGVFVAGYVLSLDEEEDSNFRLAALAALVAGAAGLYFLFTHLGAPADAWNAFRNFGTSWLAREALLYAAFMLLLLLCLLAGSGKLLGGLTALCGLALAFATAMVYTLPGVPAWNSAATPISFLLAALLLGIPLAALLSGAGTGGRSCALLVGAAALAALLVTLTQTTALQAAEPAAAASGWLMAGSPAFRLRLVLLAVAALAAFAFGLRGGRADGERKAAGIAVFLLLFCLLAASETLGRELFFSTIVRM